MHQGQNSVFILKMQKQKSEVRKLKVRREKNSKDTPILCFSFDIKLVIITFSFKVIWAMQQHVCLVNGIIMAEVWSIFGVFFLTFDDIFLCLSGTLKMNFEEFLLA